MFDPGGVGEWSPPQSPFGGFRGQKEKATHHLRKGRSIRSFTQGSRHSLQPEAELPHSTYNLQRLASVGSSPTGHLLLLIRG
jgi:hypothetical protein